MRWPILVSLLLTIGVGDFLPAAVKLPSVIGSRMVLQRDQSVPIWGWDDPGTEVTVSLAGQKVSATAAADGKWLVRLSALQAGGPHQMVIQGTNRVTVEDILVGEVWLCSGQSNMEWTVSRSLNPQQEIASGNHPRIRHIKIPHRPADAPQDNVLSGGWQECTSKTVGAFTGVGYFFARHLQGELEVPVGLIGSNWGGTRIEPWIPPVGFQQVPALQSITDKLAEFPSKNAAGQVDPQTPLALYNGMIHPLLPFPIRGALWYQGESNNGEGMLYHEKMKALIAGWRSLWKNPELPFLFVQLAPYRYGGDPTKLPGIWEAQLETLSVPGTGMAVTTDIGNVRDIHPRNKQEVGRRLALWALADTYGQPETIFSGPLYRSMRIEANRIRVFFDYTAEGLKSRDDQPLSGFQIAGSDGAFVTATAAIDGETVVVSAESITDPIAVRFGWHQESEPNLSNGVGLPASPFRTEGDDRGKLPAPNVVATEQLFTVAEYCEGVVFDHAGFGYISHGETITRFSVDGKHDVWAKTGAPNGHKVLADGTHLVCDASHHAVLHLAADGSLLKPASQACGGVSLRGPNDLSLDVPHGGFYFTDPGGSNLENPIGTIHYVDRAGVTHLIDGGLAYPNGIVVRPDGRSLLVAESQKNRILIYDVLSPGKVGPRRVFARLPNKDVDRGQIDNQPDGICLDAAGNLFVAHYGMQQVQVLNRRGRLIARYAGGNLTTSNVAFGGPQMDHVFVTGALKEGRGGLFRIPLGAPGLVILPEKSR